MSASKTWQRAKTTKVYLQRPLSERLALLFPDFKLLDLSLLDNGTHTKQAGLGVILLHGEDGDPFDYNQTEFEAVQGGIPVYRMHNRTAACDVAFEAFGGEERNPTVYFSVTVTNESAQEVTDTLVVMPRSGCDSYMINQHQEGYSPYVPNHKNWYMLKRTWQSPTPLHAESDMGYLSLVCNGISPTWQTDSTSGHSFAPADFFRFDYTLGVGETFSFCGALRAKEPIEPFDYNSEKEKAVAFWKDLCARIKHFPNTNDEHLLSVYRHLAAQCMQMLARYEGSELIATRQGDVGRFVWPYEGAQILMMLDRIGLSNHTFEAYRYYCERWLEKEGENAGMIRSNAGWNNFNGSVIWGISEHLKHTNSQAEFDYFLPHLLLMREWIERVRHSERTVGYRNIFPVGKGSDWSEQAQFWTFTDSHNVRAYRSLYEMLEQYGHAEAAPTKALYEDYRNTLLQIRDDLHRGHEQDEAYILPHELGIAFEDSENYSYYTDGAPYLLYTDLIEPGSILHRQMEEFFRRRGQFEKGLTGLMTSCSSMWDEAYFGGYGDVWYTMQSETYWVRAWMQTGEIEKARETLDAMLYFGMTTEFVVAERYCSINPWYSPWQPNGSGSARMIEMLLLFFGEK